MDKADYEDKHDLGVYMPSEKSELDRSMNVDHWLIWILNEIEWLQFQGIFEHADFRAKGDNIIFRSLLKVFHMI